MIDLQFEVLSVRAEPHAAAPTLVFRMRIVETSGRVIHAALLQCHAHIDVRRRKYSAAEGDRLSDIVGEPSHWADTMHSVLWTKVPLVLSHCEGATDVDLPISCTYDFEVASSKYFHAIDDGEVPLRFMFDGTLFFVGPSGLQVAPVAWDKEARFRLPIRVWREAMEQHFGDATWIRLGRASFDALYLFRRQRGLPTWDRTIDALCAEARPAGPTGDPTGASLGTPGVALDRSVRAGEGTA